MHDNPWGNQGKVILLPLQVSPWGSGGISGVLDAVLDVDSVWGGGCIGGRVVAREESDGFGRKGGSKNAIMRDGCVDALRVC